MIIPFQTETFLHNNTLTPFPIPGHVMMPFHVTLEKALKIYIFLNFHFFESHI
jgi:hypothetical protein